MRLTIRKYPLPIVDRPTVQMPDGAKILSVANQHDTLVVYALVDPMQRMVSRTFRITGTGHLIDPDDALAFIGTVLLMHGALVFHVFDCGEGF